jgi:hypothetical protein
MIAVDWSGKAKGSVESLWRAEVRDGKLTELRNGLDRGELSAKLLELGEAEPSMVIGLDFAFSFPAWWCEENGWSSGEDAVRAKSIFQIGGAGAVGTGSVRGMPHLLTLAKNGFGIWPFSEGWPRVVEIYPRALTGPLNKGHERTRGGVASPWSAGRPRLRNRGEDLAA